VSQAERSELRRAMAKAVWRAGYETDDSGAVLRQKDHITARHDRLCEATRYAENINDNYYHDPSNPVRVTRYAKSMYLSDGSGKICLWFKGYTKDGSVVYATCGNPQRQLSQVRPAPGYYRLDTDFANLWEYFSGE